MYECNTKIDFKIKESLFLVNKILSNLIEEMIELLPSNLGKGGSQFSFLFIFFLRERPSN